jgi:hypothetical protein
MAMATLSIINNFELEAQGRTTTGKQGAAVDGFLTPLEIDVTGTKHEVIGTLATATVATPFDDDDDVPADWDYLYFWADQDCYLQIIGPTMHVVFKIEATQPFVLPGFDGIVAAANSTAIAGGTEPTMSDIDSIVIGNYSGSTMNYQLILID